MVNASIQAEFKVERKFVRCLFPVDIQAAVDTVTVVEIKVSNKAEGRGENAACLFSRIIDASSLRAIDRSVVDLLKRGVGACKGNRPNRFKEIIECVDNLLCRHSPPCMSHQQALSLNIRIPQHRSLVCMRIQYQTADMFNVVVVSD